MGCIANLYRAITKFQHRFIFSHIFPFFILLYPFLVQNGREVEAIFGKGRVAAHTPTLILMYTILLKGSGPHKLLCGMFALAFHCH